MGMSLTEYRLNFRLNAAKKLLRYTDTDITTIMHELSCTNRTYFYKIFKDKYGLTPAEYRKNYR